MNCGGCCVSVETAVKKLKGVVDVKADYEVGQATVVYETEKVTIKKIMAAISESSFEVSLPEKKDS